MAIKECIPLSRYMNYRIGGPARYFVAVKTLEEVRQALAFAKENDIPYFILGGGTNLLMGDKGFDGLVIAVRNAYISSRPNLRRKREMRRWLLAEYGAHSLKQEDLRRVKGEEAVLVRADAGVEFGNLVDFALARGLKGIEWAAGIPGHVGGAIRGNAGAFGGEIGDVVEEVYALTPEGTLETFSQQECKFAYRSSIFKLHPGMIVVGALLRLYHDDKLALLKRAEELRAWRRTKHPLEHPNCGSMFKNIDLDDVKLGLWEKYPDMRNAVRNGQVVAAYFIDECGLKQARIGDAQVSEKHPNFVVNLGNAKAEHVVMLVNHIKHEVRKKFGIILDAEQEFIL